MKTCARCRTRIDVRASRCPQCHTDISTTDMLSGNMEAKRAIGGKVLGALIIFTLLVIWPKNGGIEHLAETTARSSQ